MSTIYTTRDDAVQFIIDSIESTGVATHDEFDIDALADELVEHVTHQDSGYLVGFTVTDDQESFSDALQRHALSDS